MTGAPHVSVMLNEVLAALRPAPGDLVIDGTFGAGGYSQALLDCGARVIAFDRDPSAGQFVDRLQKKAAFELIEGPFSSMAAIVGDQGADGVTLDLGVSSMQLDDADRGFSFLRDGPLDMRMASSGPTAADLVNSEAPEALAHILYVYGEERQSRRIAGAIARRRGEQPFTRTLDLADVVERALGGRRGAKTHPATKTFQALRIAVNGELDELEAGLVAAEAVLKAGGRLAVVTFHSLEDRIVKAFLTARSGRIAGTSRHAPPKDVGPPASFELVFAGAKAASGEEAARNPRARSAKLRAAIRTAAPGWGLAA